METENVYFNWKFSPEEREYCTNSPVVEKVFAEPGDYLVTLNATNPGRFILWSFILNFKVPSKILAEDILFFFFLIIFLIK